MQPLVSKFSGPAVEVKPIRFIPWSSSYAWIDYAFVKIDFTRTIIIIIIFYDIIFFLPIMLSKVNFVNYLNLL